MLSQRLEGYRLRQGPEHKWLGQTLREGLGQRLDQALEHMDEAENGMGHALRPELLFA